MTLEEMREKKTEYRLTCERIAQQSGVPLGTVIKIFSGLTKSPRKATFEALEKVFLEEEGKARRTAYSFAAPEAALVRESARDDSTAEKERFYTLEDYYALPEDVRAELIDGKLYYMTAPTRRHQMILGELYLLFRVCAEAHGLPCEVYLSPCDVRLDRDNYTMVQPDLLVICEDDYTEVRRVEGAPDLVVEILSPSTRMRDMSLKLYKYQNAGVREYWIVDPLKRRVTVYAFESENDYPEYYDFAATVPVHISKGSCSIDFSKILARLEARGW